MNIENRTTHNVAQGSPEWLALRAGFYTASEAPAMAGESRYAKREELIAAKATGITQEPDSFKQALYDRGHAAEAAARPLAEEIIGDDLSPVTMTAMVDGLPLLASMDGLNFDGTIGWETKLWNEALAADVQANTLSPHYTLQMDQQILVSGAERILFTCSDGTPERTVSCWYESTPERSAQLVAGWKQFAADLAAYEPPEAKPAPVVGKTPDNLPALLIQVTGAVTASNLPEYKAHALEVFRGINRTLATDQDFATAESTVKWCADVESRPAAAKEHALSQTATIDELFKTIDDISAEARRTRLELDKLVKARKEEIRGEIVAGGVAALREHIAQLNAAMPAQYMPQVPADFAGAIKGKRTVESLRGAVNDELARAKIEASNIATRIHANVKTLQASGLVVHDAAALVLKAPDDLAAIIANRVTAEQQRQEAERERIRAEEAAKLQREEEQARLEAERKRIRFEELHRLQQETAAQAQAELARQRAAEESAENEQNQALALTQQAQAAIKVDDVVDAEVPHGAVLPVAATPAAHIISLLRYDPEPAEHTGTPTLKLGQIAERLGFTLTADFLKGIGFEPAATDRASKLYFEADFPLILAALVRHIEGVQAKAAA